MTTLRRLVEFNPLVPEFVALGDDSLVTFVPLEAVRADGHSDFSRRARKVDVATGYSRFRRGDVLLPKVSPTFEAGRVAVANIATDVGAATTEVHILRARPEVDPRYVGYVCRTIPFIGEGAASQQGVGNLRRVPEEFVLGFPVVAHELDKQRAIADYLDEQTARIDALIAKQTEFMTLLDERKKALAVDAMGHLRVLTSSNGAVGLETAKRGWEKVPLRAMFLREKDIGHPDEPMVSVFRERGVIFKDDAQNLNQTAENRNIYQLVHPGWLLVNRMKAWQGSVGVSGIRGITSGHYICFRPRHTVSDPFLNHLLRSPAYVAMYALLSRGVRPGQVEIDNDLLGSLPILVPPTVEQRAITASIDSETAKIDSLIAKTREHIALARERRSSLITAAVTGQIDVRTASRRVA